MSSISSSSFVDATRGAVEHCERMANLFPDLASSYQELATLTNQKLWHQLTMKLLQFLSLPHQNLRRIHHSTTTTGIGTTTIGAATMTSTSISSFLALYETLVLQVEKKLNPLQLAQIAALVSDSLVRKNDKNIQYGSNADADVHVDADAAKAKAILEHLVSQKSRLGPPATLYLESKLGLLQLRILESTTATTESTETDSDTPKTEQTKTTLTQIKEMLQRNAILLNDIHEDVNGSAASAGTAGSANASAGSSTGATTGTVAVVHSAHYECSMVYRKAVGPPEAFYKEAIQFLNYTPLESLSAADADDDTTTTNKSQSQSLQLVQLATDVCLAALTGEGVFSFGQILVHHAPLLACLRNTSSSSTAEKDDDVSWLVDVLEAGSNGQVDKFHRLWKTHENYIQTKMPALACRQAAVEEKMTLLALVHMIVFERGGGGKEHNHDDDDNDDDDDNNSTTSTGRLLHFDEIATRIGVPLDQVEWVLMRALSVGLLRGSMDQVTQELHVTWVMPQVLTREQMKELASKFGAWAAKVGQTRNYMQEHLTVV